jgi:hypothetical protein
MPKDREVPDDELAKSQNNTHNQQDNLKHQRIIDLGSP